jgi:hypothetical protein
MRSPRSFKFDDQYGFLRETHGHFAISINLDMWNNFLTINNSKMPWHHFRRTFAATGEMSAPGQQRLIFDFRLSPSIAAPHEVTKRARRARNSEERDELILILHSEMAMRSRPRSDKGRSRVRVRD